MNQIKMIWAASLIIFTISCGGIKEGGKNPLLYEFNSIIQFADIKAGDISEATAYGISEADMLLAEIYSIPDNKKTFENTMLKIDDVYAVIEKVWSPGYLMGYTHTNEAIRKEGKDSSVEIQKYLNNLSVNENLYNAVTAYSKTTEAKSLTGVKKKFLDDEIRDFKRSGFGLGQENRMKVKEIQDNLADIGMNFSKNITDFQDTLFLSEEELTGLPDSYKKERIQGDGKYAIDMSYPSYFTFMKFAESDEARKKLSYKFLNRAVENNLDVLDDLLINRQDLVDVLGYKTYAEYRTEDRMAKNPKTVWDFETNLKDALKEKGKYDNDLMLEMKSKDSGKNADVVFPYEKRYYETKLLKEKFQLEEEEVKQYFEINNVTEGLFTITQKLFNLSYKEVKNPSVWHEDVQMFEVFDKDSGKLIGRFYLDLFPRANKYQHAAAFSVIIGKQFPKGYQLPTHTLVCNFPKPTDELPSLLPHDDVETYFHEFGHLLHGIVTTSELMSYAGTGVPRDFVEAPSQMLENWVWEKESLTLFAKHYDTGEVIPDDLLDRMLAAKNLNSGINALQQVFYGTYDFTLHGGFDPNGEKTTTDVLRELQNSITFYPYQEGTHFNAAFGHLNGYGAAYYGYMWSLVYAQDMWSVFEEGGIMNPEIGMRYRQLILEKGGTEDPLDMVTEFLGREPNNEAFLRSLLGE